MFTTSKMYDVIMIVIIIIAALNYAGHIKVDTNLMMVLMAIALYVTAKQNQKNNSKVEPLDGSTVAFDKEAFVNLNKIVNELVKEDQVTIPGNLVVKGVTTMESDVNVNGTTKCNGEFMCDGRSSFKMKDGVYSHINEGGICKIRGKLLLDAWGNSDATFESHDVIARGSVSAGNDIKASSSLTAGQNLIVGGATTLKGTLIAHGHTTCNNTTIGELTVNGASTLKGALTVNGEFWCHGRSSFKMKDNVWSHINEGGVCKIRGDLTLDGYGGTGTSVFATGFKNKDNAGEGLLFDQWSLRLQANGNRHITLHPNAGRNSTRNTRYDFDGTASDNVDAMGNIYQRLTDGHGRWLGWSKWHK